MEKQEIKDFIATIREDLDKLEALIEQTDEAVPGSVTSKLLWTGIGSTTGDVIGNSQKLYSIVRNYAVEISEKGKQKTGNQTP